MFSRILIANRAEIAVRIARTCAESGTEAVAVYSDADKNARHVEAATEAVHLPGVSSTDTYLNIPALIDAALSTSSEAVHPGYGFLAESAEFAEAVVAAGLTWIGPPPAAIRALGDKISARRIAAAAGVPVVPGVSDPIDDVRVLRDFGDEYGYPIAIKAAGGGGGRGLKVAHVPGYVQGAFDAARREARAYFGSEEVFVERYLDAPKHLEVQLLAPAPDDALWLGVRDCSMQRRHQKLIEETPPPRWAERGPEMGEAAVALSKAAGYVNAGTVEMLVDRDGTFYFLEVNSRLQVEHTVTEEVFGIDLVRCQLQIASGDDLGFTQADLLPGGHGIECRINAEDPANNFMPTPGAITRYVEPTGIGIRVDSGYGRGSEVPSAYDSLIAKLITWGQNRIEARDRMTRALNAFEIEGIKTTIPAHLLLLDNQEFIEGTHTTRTVETGALAALETIALETKERDDGSTDVLLVEGRPVLLWNPSMAASASAAVHGPGSKGGLVAPMQGTILSVFVEQGQTVEAGDAICVLEAMKMETTISAPVSGVVKELNVVAGDTATAGTVLAVIE